MKVDLRFQPLEDAVRRVGSRPPLGADLTTAEWEEIGEVLLGGDEGQQLVNDIRNRAFTSATIADYEWLNEASRMIEQATRLEGQRADPEGVERRLIAAGVPAEAAREHARSSKPLSRADFIANMRELGKELGLVPVDPDKRGGIQDPTSFRRLKLVWDIQTQQAAGYAQHKTGLSQGALDAFPAQELVRVSLREEPRNWIARWRDAGGEFYGGGRMIALKTSSIWRAISRFGTPYPPFDFNSGMGLEAIGRREAERLGVIQPDEDLTAPASQEIESINTGTEFSVANLTENQRDALKLIGDQLFDGRLRVDGDRAMIDG